MTIASPKFHHIAIDYRRAKDGCSSIIAYEVLVAHIDAQMERDRKDAERWRTFEKALRTKHFQGAAYGRRFKIVEISSMYGDETEFNDFIGAIDAELAKKDHP